MIVWHDTDLADCLAQNGPLGRRRLPGTYSELGLAPGCRFLSRAIWPALRFVFVSPRLLWRLRAELLRRTQQARNSVTGRTEEACDQWSHQEVACGRIQRVAD